MGLRSRNKGKRGEREAAAEIRRIFRTETSRGRQFAGTDDSPDIRTAIPKVHFEVSQAPYDAVLSVTPELAFRWLEGNTHNRPINQRHVERLARDMKAGRWRLTHQGIAFDVTGLLIDGQHRLCAVIEADLPVTMRVFYNEPSENRHVVDTGERRSNLDVLAISGQVGEINVILLATLRAMLAGMSSVSSRMTPGEEGERFSRHRHALEFAVEHFGHAPARGLATAQIRAVIGRAYYSVDHNRLAHFCDVLRSGMSTDEVDRLLRTFSSSHL